MKNDTEKVYIYTLDTKAFDGDVLYEKKSSWVLPMNSEL